MGYDMTLVIGQVIEPDDGGVAIFCDIAWVDLARPGSDFRHTIRRTRSVGRIVRVSVARPDGDSERGCELDEAGDWLWAIPLSAAIQHMEAWLRENPDHQRRWLTGAAVAYCEALHASDPELYAVGWGR